MIDMSNLNVSYGPTRVFDDFILSLPAGKITGILGANGAGKSTLMGAIAGLVPANGSINVYGRPHTEFSANRRRDLIFLPESTFVYDYLTSQEFARFVLAMYDAEDRATTERVDVLLRAFRLEPDRLVREMSHGMRRKASLTPFLALAPRVLLIDEAANGIDAAGLAVLTRVLRRLADTGSTVVFTSHVADLVEQVVDEVVILADGEVKERWTISHMGERLETVYLRAVGLDVDAEVDGFLREVTDE